jgi:hypothetical protein
MLRKLPLIALYGVFAALVIYVSVDVITDLWHLSQPWAYTLSSLLALGLLFFCLETFVSEKAATTVGEALVDYVSGVFAALPFIALAYVAIHFIVKYW